MSEICLVRVDQRMIHGQVCVKWANLSKANKIICVDDETSKNELVKKMFKLAVPANVKVSVYSVDTFNEKWKENKFEDNDNLMIVFKNIDTCYQTFKSNIVPFKMIQLGNIPKSPHTVRKLANEVSVTQKELNYLYDMKESGIEIEIQTIPEQKVIIFE